LVIDRLYLEGGVNVIGGLNMSINKKEQPVHLRRARDYPTLLKWVGMQPIMFHDAVSRRAWLTDGASALLHLVRVTLHLDGNDPEPTYDWVFDPAKLKDEWENCTGRQAALKTLKNWDNLNLNLYVTSKYVRSGKEVTEYATLEQRVKDILHSLEILIDRRAFDVSQEGVRIAQTLDLRRNIAGFDIMDVIASHGPIFSRVQPIDSGGAGWRDLVPELGIATIFGSGFGDLILPRDPSRVCVHWTTVPAGSDYLAASVSTLKLLHEQRRKRMEPDLDVGHLTKKIVWLSPHEPFKPCICVKGTLVSEVCHLRPVQSLMPTRPWKALARKPMAPVDIASLCEEGAVIFGEMSRRGEWRDSTSPLAASNSTSNRSAAGSTEDSSLTESTILTTPSSGRSADTKEGVRRQSRGVSGSSSSSQRRSAHTDQEARRQGRGVAGSSNRSYRTSARTTQEARRQGRGVAGGSNRWDRFLQVFSGN
jgi:hypothetical protein